MIDKSPVVSIILLVKNGDRYLAEILDAVFSQESDHKIEVVVIDSGSMDDSLDILSNYIVQLVQIPPEEFNHGETRNLGGKTRT